MSDADEPQGEQPEEVAESAAAPLDELSPEEAADIAAQAESLEPEMFVDGSDLLDADVVAAIADEEAVPEPADPLTVALAERDGYLDALQRLKAEFANHRRRTGEQATQQREQAAARLVEKLLPVLDSCDAAVAHGTEGVAPILDALVDVLGKEGLERLDPTEAPFDPEFHEAVMHEAGDDADEVPMVAQVLRAGYSWNGRVVRPAMVKVRG